MVPTPLPPPLRRADAGGAMAWPGRAGPWLRRGRALFAAALMGAAHLGAWATPSASDGLSATRQGQAVMLVLGSSSDQRALRLGAEGMSPGTAPTTVPLGSLWKLYVHAYVVDQQWPTPPLRCTGAKPQEEAYCCAPGETIERDPALAKSCGLFFDPHRLGLDATMWRHYWQSHGAVQAWLTNLEQVQPATRVPLPELMASLALLSDPTWDATRDALQRVTLEPRARPLLAYNGNRLRVKTWTWHDEQNRGVGGMAGWLVDGTPLWLGGAGGSAAVLERAAPWLAQALPACQGPDSACVQVRFFKRYALSDVQQNGKSLAAGPLHGQVLALFANGQHLAIANAQGLVLSRGPQPSLSARLGLEDFVARVVQREATPQPPQAARALAVAARSYVLRHADFERGCYAIDDDSATQRVAPTQPSAQALAVAHWSAGLVLADTDGRFHATRASPGVMAWSDAVAWANAGQRWDEILGRAYGATGFALAAAGDATECQPLPQAQRWLAERQVAWRRKLAAVPGYEAPQPMPHICQLQHGNPYADLDHGRIYAVGAATSGERLTLTHEYLHFALANHPNGRDEEFVERTARLLLQQP